METRKLAVPITPINPGERFGLWTVIEDLPYYRNEERFASCVCDCGTKRNVRVAALRGPQNNNCGCVRSAKLVERNFRHGLTKHPEYQHWVSIKNRCTNPNNKSYKWYGGRGIIMCDEWLNSFETFLKDVGLKPDQSLSLDRIRNNEGYKPGNVRWSTVREQNLNRRSNNILEYNGKSQTLIEWSEELGIKRSTLSARINRCGMSVEQAFNRKIGRWE